MELPRFDMPTWAKRTLVAVACALLAILIDVFILNADYWTFNRGLAEVVPAVSQERTIILDPDATDSLSPDGSGSASGDASADAAAADAADEPLPEVPEDALSYTTVAFDLSNEDVSSVAFDIAIDGDVEDGSLMAVRIYITDSGSSREAYDISSFMMREQSVRLVQPVDARGYAKTMSISVSSDSSAAALSVGWVVLNEPIPFDANPMLAIAIAAILFLGYALRPGSSVWSRRYIDAPAFAIAVAVCLSLVCCGMFVRGVDEPTELWGTAGCNANDEYAYLARALTEGNAYLTLDVHPWLLGLDDLSDGEQRLLGDENIYDMGARKAAKERLAPDDPSVPFKLDAAYYDGRYYVYFGVVPVLIAYLPFHLATGGDLGNTTAISVALIAIAALTCLLGDAIVRRRFSDASTGAVIVAYLGFASSLGIVHALIHPFFYNVPVVFALALLMAGAYAMLLSLGRASAAGRCALAALGALLLALTLGCRPQVAIGAIAFGVWYLVRSIRDGGSSRAQRAALAACTVAPVILVVSALLAYNHIRFGSPLDFGANYNLTGNDMTLREPSLISLAYGLVLYLLAPPHISLAFPFIEPYTAGVAYPGIFTQEPVVFGLLFQAPCLVLLVPLLLSDRVPRALKACMAGLVVGGCAIAAFDVEGAGVVARYVLDFGYLFGAAFMLGTLSLFSARDDDSACSMRGMRALAALLALLGVVAMAAMWLAYAGIGLSLGYRSIMDVWGAAITVL